MLFGFEVVRELYRSTNNNFLSGNALNLSWVLTHFFHVLYPDSFGGLIDGISRRIVSSDRLIMLPSKVIFAAFYAVILVTFFRRQKTFSTLMLYSLLGYLAYFIFSTGVHENHLFLAGILAGILYWLDKDHAPTFITWSLAANINLYLFYGVDGLGPPFQ